MMRNTYRLQDATANTSLDQSRHVRAEGRNSCAQQPPCAPRGTGRSVGVISGLLLYLLLAARCLALGPHPVESLRAAQPGGAAAAALFELDVCRAARKAATIAACCWSSPLPATVRRPWSCLQQFERRCGWLRLQRHFAAANAGSPRFYGSHSTHHGSVAPGY